MSVDEPMAVTCDPDSKDICHIMASGHIGWSADEDLRSQIDEFSCDGSAKNVVLDLSEVTLVSSAGISSLMTISGELRENGGKLILSEVPPRIEQLFEVVGMSSVMPIADNFQRAREMI